mgnify:CR=1 FL=1
MHQILVNLLEQFGIEMGWGELDNTENLDEYRVFDIYDDEDSNITTEGNLTETYYITINYWYKNLNNINKYRKIKKVLKENGFEYNGGADLRGEGVRGKNMDFIYTLDVTDENCIIHNIFKFKNKRK